MKRLLTDKLFSWKVSKHRKPLLLKGARQVGKSWILKDFGTYFNEVHYVNFERSKDYHDIFDNKDPLEIIRKIELISSKSISIKNDLIIFDELQECEGALTSLKYFCEELPEMAICAAGSHIGVIFSSDKFPVGKVDELELYPMSFEEYLLEHTSKLHKSFLSFSISEVEHKLLWREFLNFLFCGGMPEVVAKFQPELSSVKSSRVTQKSLIDAYCSDFSRYSGSQDGSHTRATFLSIPAQLEKSYDDTVKRFKYSGIIPNRSKYSQFKGPIDWLTTIQLIHKNKQISKIEPPIKGYEKENLFKLFWHDIGLLHAHLNISFNSIVKHDYGTYKGFIAENFVATELVSAGYDLMHWNSDRKKSEIEFLITYNDEIIPIEVKSGVKSTNAKSLKVFKEIFKPKTSLKFSGKNLRFEDDQINAPLYLAGRVNDLIEHFNIR